MIHPELFVRFVVSSLVAFGGGQAALPPVERMAVQDTQGLTPPTLGAAVAFGYVTPGPVLITATFVGQQVAGLSGALAGTVGAFAAPWALTRAVAHQVRRFAQVRRLLTFGAAAAPAVIGILGVTAFALSREVFVSWPHVGIGGVIFALATWTRINPVGLLALGGFLGWSLKLR